MDSRSAPEPTARTTPKGSERRTRSSMDPTTRDPRACTRSRSSAEGLSSMKPAKLSPMSIASSAAMMLKTSRPKPPAPMMKRGVSHGLSSGWSFPSQFALVVSVSPACEMPSRLTTERTVPRRIFRSTRSVWWST